MTTFVNANGYSIDPSASFSLDISSPYLKDVPLSSDTDREELSLRCKAACSYIERYCRRKFARQTYTGIYTVRQDGSIELENPPVFERIGVCYCNSGWLNVVNPTSYAPTVSTMQDSLKLYRLYMGSVARRHLLMQTIRRLEICLMQ